MTCQQPVRAQPDIAQSRVLLEDKCRQVFALQARLALNYIWLSEEHEYL